MSEKNFSANENNNELDRDCRVPSKKAGRKVYFNKPQRLTQLIGANTTVIVAGRRTCKTDSIAAPFVLRNMQCMPGSTLGIVVLFLLWRLAQH